MTKNEISFLLNNGYTVADVMQLSGDSDYIGDSEENAEPDPKEEPEKDESKEPEKDEKTKSEPKIETDSLEEQLKALQKTVEKLSTRIAKAAIQQSSAGAQTYTADDLLETINKKLRGEQ